MIISVEVSQNILPINSALKQSALKRPNRVQQRTKKSRDLNCKMFMEVENDGKQQAFLTEPSTMLLNVYNDNKMCINQMKAIFT